MADSGVHQADVMFRVDSQQIPGDNENIWDDTALIKAYDKAVESVKKDLIVDGENVGPQKNNNQKRRRRNKKKKLKQWNVGDRCQAKYSVDGIYYEAVINSVNHEQGSCWVTFKEYGNEEEVELSELKPTQYKDKPMRQDISENETGSNMEYSDYPALTPERLGAHHGPWGPNPWMMAPMLPPQHFMPPFAMPSVSPYTVPMPYFPRPSGYQSTSARVPSAPPPPPPIRPNMETDDEDDALHSMLIAWYMSGYHTGYYQGLKDGEKQSRSPASKKFKMKKKKAQMKQAQNTPSNCKEPSEEEI